MSGGYTSSIKWTDDLTPWDLNRPVRKLVEDDRTVTLAVKDVNSLLKCPICLSVVDQTSTVMGCLHRFCKGCFTKCLESSKKECPACRIRVASKRNTRHDENFDEFIRKIYPNVEKVREDEEIATQDYNQRKHINSNFAKQSKAGQELQATYSSKRGTKRSSVAAPDRPDRPERSQSAPSAGGPGGPALLRASSTSSVLTSSSSYGSMAQARGGGELKKSKLGSNVSLRTASSTSSIDGSSAGARAGGTGATSTSKKKQQWNAANAASLANDNKKVDFVLRKHPDEKVLPPLEKELLRTPLRCKVWHIQRYLAQKLDYEDCNDFEVVMLNKKGDPVALDGTHDLRYVSETICEGKPITKSKDGKGRGKGKGESNGSSSNSEEGLVLFYRSSGHTS